MKFFEDKIILVLGGTGTIGSEIVSQLLNYNPKAIRVLSNSENELWEAKVKFSEHKQNIRFLLGDIRNFDRIKRACEDVDYIFNAAAIKHVPFSEYNPMEAINVNIHGLDNIIEAAFERNVKKLIHISTDKAVIPTTVMGATKLLGERLCISRELAKGKKGTTISCVRFGNVLGSRGSIIPLIKRQIKEGNIVTLTDENMRRFFLSIFQAVELVLKAALLAQGGEIFVLKMPTMRIKDLIEVFIEEYCKKINKNKELIKIEIIGARRGEKIDEELISSIEFSACYETDEMYIIKPAVSLDSTKMKELKVFNSAKVVVNKDFKYNTEDITPLKKETIKELLYDYNLL